MPSVPSVRVLSGDLGTVWDSRRPLGVSGVKGRAGVVGLRMEGVRDGGEVVRLEDMVGVLVDARPDDAIYMNEREANMYRTLKCKGKWKWEGEWELIARRLSAEQENYIMHLHLHLLALTPMRR